LNIFRPGSSTLCQERNKSSPDQRRLLFLILGEINKLKTRYLIENDRIWRFDSFKEGSGLGKLNFLAEVFFSRNSTDLGSLNFAELGVFC
jgi:hypothetical protein